MVKENERNREMWTLSGHLRTLTVSVNFLRGDNLELELYLKRYLICLTETYTSAFDDMTCCLELA